MPAMNEGEEKTWRATLTPHRSLGRRGFTLLMAVFGGLSLGVGLLFYAIGAWPVMGFMGLDVALVWFAFRRNFRDGDRAEHIEVKGGELTVERVIRSKTLARLRFVRSWVRIELEQDRARELIGRLLIRFKGSATEIASFLSPAEREEFAKALERALITVPF
jgi:uncharacterized membrane protein